MKVEILIRDASYFFEDFIQEHNMEPYLPENQLAEIPFWTGLGGILLSKTRFEGEPCYRVTGDNINSLIKFLGALEKWDQR